jgi:hypothetical protein
MAGGGGSDRLPVLVLVLVLASTWGRLAVAVPALSSTWGPPAGVGVGAGFTWDHLPVSVSALTST